MFPAGSDDKEYTCNAGDPGSVSWSGRSPGRGNGNPLQDPCLENSMDRRAFELQSTRSQGLDATEQLTHIDAQRLPKGLSCKESACQRGRHRFDPWVRKGPWRRKGQPTPLFLPGKSHGQGSLAGYSPWDCKSQTQLRNQQEERYVADIQGKLKRRVELLLAAVELTKQKDKIENLS